jgi:hypothetical protein
VQPTEPAESPYGADGLGSKYQGQRGPTPSRYWQNFSASPRSSQGSQTSEDNRQPRAITRQRHVERPR